MANGLIIAAPSSGSGKTLVTMGLLGALKNSGVNAVSAKTGPDYIDASFHALTTGQVASNLDPWAMSQNQLRARAQRAAEGADFLLIEGVMGLFDGAVSGNGSTADLAAALNLPVVLVVDVGSMAQSIAAVVHGFSTLRADINVAGVILNRVASERHQMMLRSALEPLNITYLGALGRDDELVIPSRHLGLTLPKDFGAAKDVAKASVGRIEQHINLDLLQEIATPIQAANEPTQLAPLGQRIAIARDQAFAFIYPHILSDWQAQGAELSFFSPLADEAPNSEADAIFLPGGYPELHAENLSNANNFASSMRHAVSANKLIYGECGGYMVLGQSLTNKQGEAFAMLGLLPHASAIDRPRRQLGYRQLSHNSPLPWPKHLRGHEFHYSTQSGQVAQSLFDAADAQGNPQPPMGCVAGNVMGSYAHIIDAAQ
ncbi:cobyrinate a,c-diamide synthase [Maritalea sp.]|uniref:cobyrinate a,c-diamide synthase n=1 Tax=Maritalea sp. TaxID=2003361 RepID=UPI0039E46393